jgi:hypothetical protein
LCLAH